MADIRINYVVDTSQVEQADDALEQLDKTTEETTDSTEEFNEATSSLGDQLKNMANRVSIAGKGLGDLAFGLGKTSTGAASATKASKALSFAMKAIPIVALVAALASLVAFFTKTERGAQKLRVITATLGATFDVVTDGFIAFGEAIVGIFDNPREAWEAFTGSLRKGYEFVKGQVFDRFTATFTILVGLFQLGVLKLRIAWNEFTGDDEEVDSLNEKLEETKNKVIEAAKVIKEKNEELVGVYNKVKDAVIGAKDAVVAFVTQVSESAKAAGDLERRLNNVLVAERKLSVARAQANAQIEKEKLLAEDVTKTFEEREAAAVRAFELESTLLAKEIALQRERVSIIQQQNALSESSEEDLQAEADALIRLAEIEQASGTKQIELNNKINAIRAEQQRGLEAQIKLENDLAKAKEDSAEESTAKQIEAEQALADFRAGLLIKEESDLRKRQQLLITAELETRDFLLDNQELFEEERLLIIEESEERIREIKAQTQEEFNEGQREGVELSIELSNQLLGVLNAFSANRIAGLERQKAAELAVEGQTAEEKEKIEEKFNALVLKEEQKIARRNKVSALFDIGLNTAEAITKALPNIPLAVVIGALGAAQAIAVATTPLPFKDGVINLQGGVKGKDSIPSILMPGESVLTTRETSDFLPTLTAIRKGYVDPDLLNAVSTGAGVSSPAQVVQVPGTEFYLDEKGFAAHIRTSNARTIKKQRRYSTKLFS